VLLLISGVVITAVVATLGLSRWVNREDELGSVSGKWLSEYRQDRES
jgi:hypothetical protein